MNTAIILDLSSTCFFEIVSLKTNPISIPMEGILNLLNLYSEEKQPQLELTQYLQIFQNHQSFGSRNDNSNCAEINQAVSIINAKLNNADSRYNFLSNFEIFIIKHNLTGSKEPCFWIC